MIGPASLFLCQCLTQCPVRTSKDVASGLLVCSILMSFNEETHRIVPECVEFLRSVVCAFVPPSEALGKCSKYSTFIQTCKFTCSQFLCHLNLRSFSRPATIIRSCLLTHIHHTINKHSQARTTSENFRHGKSRLENVQRICSKDLSVSE